MSKPSIFSRDYEQKMKRRKLNIILFLLLLVCLAFFGGRYYLKKNNISILPDFSKSKKQSVNKDAQKQSNTKPEDTKPVTPSPSVLEYSYTLNNKSVIKLEYIANGDAKELKDFKGDGLNSIEYSISPDKKNAVFVDKGDQTLIVVDSNGNFVDITKPSIVYNSGKKITRKVLDKYDNYTWNAKPQFTSEGNIVYISDMPNTKPGSALTLWVTKPQKDAKHDKVTKLSDDLSKCTFEGFDDQGRLKINSDGETLYISKDGSKATKE